jgi:hypothetical protein
MNALVPVLFLLLAPSPPVSAPSPSPSAEASGPVLLFLIDNSASLPPLDPEQKRVDALEKMFTFLSGHPYRLVLFGGRNEIYVDDPGRYRNNGQWTDFYFAFDKARELMAGYPKGTEFKMVLLTDGLLDPDPKDWENMSVPNGADLKGFSAGRTLDLLRELGVPLYVILVGEPPTGAAASGDREQAPIFVLDMVRAANGAKASPTAQSLAAFFGDNGLLLKKFVFRVAPSEGLVRLRPIVERIASPARAGVEAELLGALVLPLVLFLSLLLGILVRSFPGAGDVEILELAMGTPVHVAVDRLHKLGTGSYASTGLSLVAEAKSAQATLTYQRPAIDMSGTGLDSEGLDATTLKLMPLSIEELGKELFELKTAGSKEEKIYALNLDYMAQSFEAADAERVLTTAPADRRSIPPLDFLRAKAHLLKNDALREKLVAPRVQCVGYGKDAERKELTLGSRVKIGRYGFVVGALNRGGRKDVRLSLYYDRVPSVLGLKSLLPKLFQRLVRLRRSSERIVS